MFAGKGVDVWVRGTFTVNFSSDPHPLQIHACGGFVNVSMNVHDLKQQINLQFITTKVKITI